MSSDSKKKWYIGITIFSILLMFLLVVIFYTAYINQTFIFEPYNTDNSMEYVNSINTYAYINSNSIDAYKKRNMILKALNKLNYNEDDIQINTSYNNSYIGVQLIFLVLILFIIIGCIITYGEIY